MDEVIEVTGSITRFTAKVLTNGLTAEDMKVNIKWTKNTAMAFMHGLMDADIMAHGKMVNNMDKAYMNFQTENAEKENGLMVQESNGHQHLN